MRGAPRVLPGPPSGVTPTAVTRVTAVALACSGAADPLAGAAAAGVVAWSSVGTVPDGNHGAGAILAGAAAAASVRAAAFSHLPRSGDRAADRADPSS